MVQSKATENILHYILNEYPYPSDLTKTRITKLVYLVDWYSAKKMGKQISDIEWYFDHYGPYVSDVLDVADEDPKVRIRKTVSAYGGTKYVVEPKDPTTSLLTKLNKSEEDIIDQVIADTQNLSWNKFIDFVYQTYPIKKESKYNKLNLVELAESQDKFN